MKTQNFLNCTQGQYSCCTIKQFFFRRRSITLIICLEIGANKNSEQIQTTKWKQKSKNNFQWQYSGAVLWKQQCCWKNSRPWSTTALSLSLKLYLKLLCISFTDFSKSLQAMFFMHYSRRCLWMNLLIWPYFH